MSKSEHRAAKHRPDLQPNIWQDMQKQENNFSSKLQFEDVEVLMCKCKYFPFHFPSD